MRLHKFGVFLLLLQVAVVANAANWIPIRQPSGYTSDLFYDASSLVRQQTYVTVWIKKGSDNLQRQILDCGHQRYLILFVRSGPDGEIKNYSMNTEWISIPTNDDYVLRLQRQVCGLYDMGP
jgi:hypothetical protein